MCSSDLTSPRKKGRKRTNSLVRRYGGLKGFVRFRPFFLGLVLGEFLTAAAWMLIDACLGLRGHNIFPGPG